LTKPKVEAVVEPVDLSDVGEIKDILEQKGSVRVELMIFGRPTSVELEYWQVEEV
jgi:transcription antitermination factor NusG